MTFCITLCLPLVGNASSLSDIEDNKNKPAIEHLYNSGIISGYPDGTFKPEKTVNRAELVKILVGAKGQVPTFEEYQNCFPDVTTEWFAPYVCYAKINNWIAGYPDGTFQPSKEVNKVEAIKILINAQGYNLPSSINEKLFDDVDNSAWYAPFIKVAKDKGLLEQTTGKYGSSSSMKRAEITENIYRSIIVDQENISNFWEYLFKPTVIEGRGTKATEQFSLQEGLAVLKLSHKGESNFIVQLLNSTGETIEYLSNEIGDFQGTTALKIPKNDTYLLNVDADGDWEIEINQSTKTLKTENGSRIEGAGKNISGLVQLSGLKKFTLNHDGESNFIVILLNSKGETMEYLSNEIGTFNGSMAKNIEQGTYIFDVDADGNWSIDIE